MTVAEWVLRVASGGKVTGLWLLRVASGGKVTGLWLQRSHG